MCLCVVLERVLMQTRTKKKKTAACVTLVGKELSKANVEPDSSSKETGEIWIVWRVFVRVRLECVWRVVE